MAFTSTANESGVSNIVGVKRIVTGTYVNTGGSTGGDVATGLRRVLHFDVQPTGSAVIATQSVPNETFPLESGDVTIVTSADESGTWIAYGD